MKASLIFSFPSPLRTSPPKVLQRKYLIQLEQNFENKIIVKSILKNSDTHTHTRAKGSGCQRIGAADRFLEGGKHTNNGKLLRPAEEVKSTKGRRKENQPVRTGSCYRSSERYLEPHRDSECSQSLVCGKLLLKVAY